MPFNRLPRPAVVVTLFALLLLPHTLVAQVEPPSTGGAVVLSQELRMLGHNRRVLMIGAHPDDEDTELLATLVRGYGVEAAYLSLNRGEGGQNLIGPELGEGLGILRSGELLAARRLDGARQFFTRSYDFGFSKTLADTWAHWPQDSVLKDVVRIIRRFRPQVVVSIFSGTPRDGHGQHQAAGWAAQEGFRIAGDSTRFPELLSEEQLPAWTPLKLYRNTRYDTAGTTIRIDGGSLDEAVGQTYHQIAMRGRSLHRSQDMGRLQEMSASENRLMLWVDRTTDGRAGMFAGIDTSLGRAAAAPGGSTMGTDRLRAPIDRYVELVSQLESSGSGFRGTLVSRLAAAEVELRRAEQACAAATECSRGALAATLTDQESHVTRALFTAAGLLIDARVDEDRVAPGQSVAVTLTARNTGTDTLAVCHRFGGSGEAEDPTPLALLPGQSTEWRGAFKPGSAALLSQPYFLRQPRQGDQYVWPRSPAGATLGTPFEQPEGAWIILARGPAGECSSGAALFRELSWRTNDQARGEVRRPLWVVPRIDVRLDPADLAWPLTPRTSRRFTVTLTSGVADSTSGTVTVEVPAGWPKPPPQAFHLAGESAHAEFHFDITPPAGATAGRLEFRASATESTGARDEVGQVFVDYPHIRPRAYVRRAVAQVTLAPIVLPKVARIGYVRGAADQVPEALTEAGMTVELLDRATLERGDLSRFPVIVIGPRAYETDTALVRNNARLLEYARTGGLVVVQYQQQIWFNGGFAPFPATVGGGSPPVVHDRVTDENAAVKLLDPQSGLFTGPNQIGASDWEGWVQERGLYFAHSWDPAWRPLLELHDPGDPPLQGGLLIAKLGKGTFVYTGLSFFRQLPAGVPGAFRLFANLLALAERGSGMGTQ
ncbi:MAG: PIG-L family deacetylase [Gemmatimonadota bacterium]